MSFTNLPDPPETKWAKNFPKEDLPVANSLDDTPDRAKREYELDGNPYGDLLRDKAKAKAEKNDKP